MIWLLVADANDDARNQLAETLRERGYLVRTASDSDELVHVLDAADETPALIVLDPVMPRVSGRELLRLVRSVDRGARAPILLLSTLVGEQDLPAYSVAAILPKPVVVERLFVEVERLCQSAAQTGKRPTGDIKVCSLCNQPMSRPTNHCIGPSASRAIGSRRCKICGKAARVRCVLGLGDFWVECGEKHLTRTA